MLVRRADSPVRPAPGILAALAPRLVAGLAAFVLLAAVSLPYLWAAQAGAPDHVFGGFLFNPKDGSSYLAKMLQGWEGAWRFRLPYTAEPGQGAYLFLFYLFLGHLARALGLPVLLTFHLARLVGAGVLLAALYRFFAAHLPDARLRSLAFSLAALGSGWGWLALPWTISGDTLTADLWVAEAYPFLSAFATPHFGLGLALVLWLLTPPAGEAEPVRLRQAAGVTLAAAALAILSPFGVVVVLVVLGGASLWALAEAGRPAWLSPLRWLRALDSRLPWVLLGGAPWLLYDFWAARADPVLAGWDAQNLTPSPPVWDLLLSFAPVLLLGLPGMWLALRRNVPGGRALATWAVLGLLLLYLPSGLQRRFMLGLYVPLAGLAAIGLDGLAARTGKRLSFWVLILLLLALPSNLVLLLGAGQAAATRSPELYLTQGEARAYAWLVENTPPDALVLAGPESGLYIPAYTGRRVIYGHPYETVNAAEEEAAVRAFFSRPAACACPEERDEDAAPPMADPGGFLAARGVEYVFVGPRELALGGPPALDELDPAYSDGGVTIYAVR